MRRPACGGVRNSSAGPPSTLLTAQASPPAARAGVSRSRRLPDRGCMARDVCTTHRTWCATSRRAPTPSSAARRRRCAASSPSRRPRSVAPGLSRRSRVAPPVAVGRLAPTGSEHSAAVSLEARGVHRRSAAPRREQFAVGRERCEGRASFEELASAGDDPATAGIQSRRRQDPVNRRTFSLNSRTSALRSRPPVDRWAVPQPPARTRPPNRATGYSCREAMRGGGASPDVPHGPRCGPPGQARARPGTQTRLGSPWERWRFSGANAP